MPRAILQKGVTPRHPSWDPTSWTAETPQRRKGSDGLLLETQTGEQNPQRKGRGWKNLLLTFFGVKIRGTKFELKIRDAATHRKKKKRKKKQRRKPGSDHSQIPMTQMRVGMTLMAQQGRGEHVSGEEELPSATCRAANMSKHLCS